MRNSLGAHSLGLCFHCIGLGFNPWLGNEDPISPVVWLGKEGKKKEEMERGVYVCVFVCVCVCVFVCVCVSACCIGWPSHAPAI